MHSEHVVVHALFQHQFHVQLHGSPLTKVAHCRMPTAFTACTGNNSKSSSGEVGPNLVRGWSPDLESRARKNLPPLP